MRLIDADSLVREIAKYFAEQVKAIPTIEERKTGEWVKSIYHDDEFTWPKYHCSVCGIEKKIGWVKDVFYCPNCGADMRGEEHG